ncbi:MAG: hypothetical protein LH618_17905, partial [Saprospiraceae bacterium]|nr:hypothetical protein [Saprospiraceae bacterium]
PLDELLVVNAKGNTLIVIDGAGKEYFRAAVRPVLTFTAGGALGSHTVRAINQKGKPTDLFTFKLDARTSIDDGGYYKSMFDLLYRGLEGSAADGSEVRWNGKTYRYFVPWILDHCQTMKGQKYFKGYGAELVDLLRETQRADGMIYSFVQYMDNADYFLTRDKFTGYSKKIGDRVFVRQPTENHPEYLYVNTIYQCWKADGNDAWMTKNLASAAKALDYALQDPAR